MYGRMRLNVKNNKQWYIANTSLCFKCIIERNKNIKNQIISGSHKWANTIRTNTDADGVTLYAIMISTTYAILTRTYANTGT